MIEFKDCVIEIMQGLFDSKMFEFLIAINRLNFDYKEYLISKMEEEG